MSKSNRWIFIIGLLVGLGIALAVAIPRLQPHNFYGTVLQSPDKAYNFELDGSAGQKIRLDQFEGQMVLLYFGYTFCPDVCPATLSELAKAMDDLGNDSEDVQVIMISVDPGRDSPSMLAEYVAHFHPSFLGATGTDEEIAQIATLYGIFYEKHEGTQATGYLVDHTATVMGIDRDGHLKIVFPFGAPGEEIAEDLKVILN
jgi:protein SCO1